jgi:hypothetical protein
MTDVSKAMFYVRGRKSRADVHAFTVCEACRRKALRLHRHENFLR